MREAIILAGGFGTRLRPITETVPKPMIPISGAPFLEYLLKYLIKSGVEKICLAVGYKYELIQDYFGNSYQKIPIIYSIEEKPLGTGGAIIQALKYTKEDNLLVVNGDTFFNINIDEMWRYHIGNNSKITLAVKNFSDCSRYGRVIVNSDNTVIKFKEKGITDEGLINGGIYAIKRNIFDELELNECFSFENNFLLSMLDLIHPKAYISDGYFIDIGVPEDLDRAQSEIQNMIE